MIKKYIKENTTSKQRVLFKNQINKYLSFFDFGNLNKLAIRHNTDKWGSHWYTEHYDFHFRNFKKSKIKIFEIGVGGYDTPYLGGNSLRMWRDYFPNGKVISLDIEDKSPLNEKRIKIYKGSQTDKEILEIINNENGPFDIIIDDGSHINSHVIFSFQHLFPLLKNGGIYAIEDTQTSYFSDFGANSMNFDDNSNIVGYFKNLIHGLNYAEYQIEKYEPNYFEKHIESIHFYHNLIIIHKKESNKKSNLKA